MNEISSENELRMHKRNESNSNETKTTKTKIEGTNKKNIQSRTKI